MNSLRILFLVTVLSTCCYSIAYGYHVELVKKSPICDNGEGPHWDAETNSLYYVDILKREKSVWRFDLSTQKFYGATIDNETTVSFIIPVKGEKNHFAVGISRRVGVIYWDGISKKAILKGISITLNQSSVYDGYVFNDAKADSYGRFYGGTKRLALCYSDSEALNASLYRLDKCNGLTRLKKNILISNGLAWDDKINKFYYIDSCLLNVLEFDYDPKTGDIHNKRVAVDFRINGEYPGFVPDGMTIDSEGSLYVATFGGSEVIKVDPRKRKILFSIRFPAKQITSVAFGGPKLDILFVTTAAKYNYAGLGQRDTQPQSPYSGYLYMVTGLNATGYDGAKVRMCYR